MKVIVFSGIILLSIIIKACMLDSDYFEYEGKTLNTDSRMKVKYYKGAYLESPYKIGDTVNVSETTGDIYERYIKPDTLVLKYINETHITDNNIGISVIITK